MAQDAHLPPPAVAGRAEAKTPASPVQFLTVKTKQMFEGISELAVLKSNSPPTPDPPPSPVSQEDEPRLDATDEAVLQHVNMHQKFRLPAVEGVEVTDLPSFDEFLQYGKVTEETQRNLWATEVSRLVRVVANKGALSFQGSEDLAIDSIKAHETFTTLADRFLQALSIVSYDGECLAAEHKPELCQISLLERSRVTLGFICNKEEEDDTSKDDTTRLEDLFAFIDYCTAVWARILYAKANSKEVAHRVLSHLAKISAKAKVVSIKPEECARLSMDTGISEEELVALRRRASSRDGQDPGQDAAAAPGLDATGRSASVAATPGRGGDSAFGREVPDERLDMMSKKGALRNLYFVQCTAIRVSIIETLMRLIVRLRGNSRLTRVSYSSYEISAIVYTTGFGSFQTLVFQDRDSSLDGSSEQAIVDSARHALRQLDDTVRHIKEASTDTTVAGGRSDEKSIGTQMTWAYAVYNGSEPNEEASSIDLLVPERVQLRSMSNVISVIVPLVFASPKLVRYIQMVLEMAMDRELHLAPEKGPDRKDTSGTSTKYTASFCLDTREHRAVQAGCGEKDSKSLSNSLIRRNGLLSGKGIALVGRVNTFTDNCSNRGEQRRAAERRKAALSQIRKNQAELEAASKIMKTWVLEEKGVMVQCKAYVSTVMAACVLLTAGGIAVGITVGERIRGVDPFNITTYCWVLAGFLVIIAKSVRVHDWPWNDFLHGRVLCKSVSELSSVTGMHAQLIIAYLLECEQTSFLETRGPFHIAFHRKADDGFSIDEPLSMWTLLLSGLIMTEVESPLGRSLICLDLRKGTDHGEVKDWKRFRVENENLELCCPRLQDQSIDINTNEPRARLAYARGMSWSRMLGVYGNNKALFV